MVNHYHSHLYKEYVLADLTRAPSQLGLRWRTQQEVENGRGHATCGNKHCPGGNQALEASASQSLLSGYYKSPRPTNNEEEEKLLEKLPHGIGLHDFEVPFTYPEQGETKTELVKLRLCLKCSPLLFQGGALDARRARSKRSKDGKTDEDSSQQVKPGASSNDADSSAKQPSEHQTRAYAADHSSDSEDKRKHRRHSKHKKRMKKDRKH